MMWRTMAGALVSVLLAGTAGAQDWEGSWEELLLSGRLRRGLEVSVHGVDGVVRDFTRDELVIASGAGTWRWAAAEVRAIEKRDPIAGSVFVGFGGGLLGMGMLAKARYGDAAVYLMPRAYAVAGLAALVAGVVDANERETVYRTGGLEGVSVSPMATERGAGVLMAVGW